MDNKVYWLEPVVCQATSPKQKIEIGSSGRLFLSTPLHDRLTTLKNEIDGIANIAYWDDAKKITNPYEYIFLSLQKRMHRSIAAIVPLSRSYFKMIELWDALRLDRLPLPITTAHSAEGPGGFLEAIQHRTNNKTPMVAMTLKSTERTVPGWRKSHVFLTEHPQVHITYGADGTGNLYAMENQHEFRATAARLNAAGVDIYTADGGFDFSTDYNGQETTVQRLLAAEALAGLLTLKRGGTMIIKFFDTKCKATLELMWILATCFERTGLIKPHTSRPANSERYWVGENLCDVMPWVIELLCRLTTTDTVNGWDSIFEEAPWSPTWLAPIQEFQEEIERAQYDNIQLTLNIIRSPKREQIQDLLLKNIQNSRRWITRHRISENRQYAGLRDDQIVALNLEEAQAPFQVGAVRTSSRAQSPQTPMHRASISVPTPPPPAVRAWRSALPPSILGRVPSQKGADTPPPTSPALAGSHEAASPEPEHL
jgi:hypothetical protein